MANSTRLKLLLCSTLCASTLLASGCESEPIDYYEETSTAVETTAELEFVPNYDSLLIGSTYSSLPLTAMTRVALLGETYSDAEVMTAAGSREELLNALVNRTVNFAIMPISESEVPYGFKAVPVAKQALVFYVADTNPIESLTKQQIIDIYSGKHIAWEEFGGSKTSITPLQRGETLAAQECLELLVGDQLMKAPRSIATGQNDVFDFSPDDIGLGIFAAGIEQYNSSSKFIAVDGIAPTAENIDNRTYPLIFDVCAVYDQTDMNAVAMAEWLLTSDGQTIAATAGFLPKSSDYDGYRYSLSLYNSVGTSESFRTEDTFRYYYTLTSDIISRDESGKFTVTGLKNAELAADIDNFIAESVAELETTYEDFKKFLTSREMTGDYRVDCECINGYLSVVVRLAYTDGERDFTYRQRCRTYNLYTGETLEFSDLFYRDIDFSSPLHQSINLQSATPYDNWNSIRLMKREFFGLPMSFGYSLRTLSFDIDNQFFYNGESFTLDDVSDLMVIYEPRDMAGIFEDGMVVRRFNEYTPDGCDPEALYETIVLDGHESIENLVYYRLSASKLGMLSTEVCDKINNAMYTFLKNEMSPDVIKAKIAATGASVQDFYYVNQQWKPTFYGTSFVMFESNGSVEYVNEKFEYGTFDDFRRRVFFSLETGDTLTPAQIFTNGWESAATYRGFNADGTYTELGKAPEWTVTPDGSETAVERIVVNGIEIGADENGVESLTVSLIETVDAKLSYITLTVPTTFINWN